MSETKQSVIPIRVQRQRKKGWRKPDGVVCVTRPGRWGNPYPTAAQFEQAVEAVIRGEHIGEHHQHIRRIVDDCHELRGKPLACWCALTKECHADVLLRLCNNSVVARSSESDRDIRDTLGQSRKGRPPKGDRAMTPAERKRLQRQREKEAKRSVPRWLQLRQEIWQLIQERFAFDSVDQLACALQAVGMAIRTANCFHSVDREEMLSWYWPLIAISDPHSDSIDEGHREMIRTLLEELQAYSWQGGDKFPDAEHTNLFELLRDIVDCHDTEKTESQQ